jgi:hypothetical protein
MHDPHALTAGREPAAPALSTPASAPAARGRRDFLRAAGLGAGALALAACGGAAERGLVAPIAGPTPTDAIIGPNGSVQLDFNLDADVLNYAYALEQLEAAFYIAVTSATGFASTFAANEQRILLDLRDHEIVHRDFLRAALGAAAIPNLTPDFSAVNFASRTSVLQTAQTFEDLGVGAYNGAGKYLRDAGLLSIAGKIVSVEARHAAAIRGVLNGNRTAAFAPNAFDPALAPSVVLQAADPFIVENITVINA